MPYKKSRKNKKLFKGGAAAAPSGSNYTEGRGNSSVFDLVADTIHSEIPHSCFKICKETHLSVTSQYCEVCGASVQAHGDLFEARYGAQIALEIATEERKIGNIKQEQIQERAKEIFTYWIDVTSKGKGKTDPFDIDFGSGKSQIPGGHYPTVSSKVIKIMQRKYGIGISVKIACDSGNGPAPCLGDMCRISEHFEKLEWTLLVGVYKQQEDCKCITNIHLLKISPDDRTKFFCSITSDDIYRLHGRCSTTYMKGKEHWGKTGKSQYLSNPTVKQMKTNKTMLLTPTPKPTRLQCYINANNFKKLLEIFKRADKASSLTKTRFPELYKPILLPTRSARKAAKSVNNSTEFSSVSRKKPVKKSKGRTNRK